MQAPKKKKRPVLLHPLYDAAVAILGRLHIVNQETGVQELWQLNEEQLEVLRILCSPQGKRALIAKARQVGLTTLGLAYLMLFALGNAHVEVATVTDTAKKAKENLARIHDWLTQLQIPHEASAMSIKLPNGTIIHAASAVSRAGGGESRLLRGKSIQCAHLSEAGLYSDDYAAFRSALAAIGLQGQVYVESTISAYEGKFVDLWRDPNCGWEHCFLGLEKHSSYTRDPNELTDAQWEELKATHKFTSRKHAAWFAHKLRTTGGAVSDLLREYPVTPNDLVSNSSGRWILNYTKAKTKQHGKWEGKHYHGWTEYLYDKAQDGPCVMGVDASGGVGGDAATITVMDQATKRIKATFTSNTVKPHELAYEVKEAIAKYKPQLCLVEYEGRDGGNVYATLAAWRQPVSQYRVGDAKHGRLQAFGADIMSGKIPVGEEFVREILSSRCLPPKSGKGNPEYVGADDLLASASICHAWICKALPEFGGPTRTAPPPDVDRSRFYVPLSVRNPKDKWKNRWR